MAQESPVWVPPLKSGVQAVDKIFQSLATWLNAPTFPGGIVVGNGTPASFSSSTGAQTAAMPQALTVDATGNVKIVGTGSLNANPLITSLNAADLYVQHGTAVITAASTGTAITFPTAFTAAPLVIACPGDAGGITSIVVKNVTTTTTFTVLVFNGTATAVASGSFRVNWMAIGH